MISTPSTTPLVVPTESFFFLLEGFPVMSFGRGFTKENFKPRRRSSIKKTNQGSGTNGQSHFDSQG